MELWNDSLKFALYWYNAVVVVITTVMAIIGTSLIDRLHIVCKKIQRYWSIASIIGKHYVYVSTSEG